ncbi:hypothetical protein [Nocardia sp. NPDC049707]|uniref:hypothetical protein n=1 Tax=Nocardia sp. NPDC049707 TaxID=3154735 RepID=UPI003434F90C
MLIVLNWGGSTAAAFGIHGLTATLVIVTGVLLIRARTVLNRQEAPPPTPDHRIAPMSFGDPPRRYR